LQPAEDLMSIEVKICGLNNEAALQAALGAGADFVGMVFYPPSPRSLAPTEAAALAGLARGQAKIVALVVDPDDALLETVVNTVEPDMIQLHGGECPERVAEIRRRWNRPVMKAIKVETADDARSALSYRHADLILFDARPSPGARMLPGGNGVPFDWRTLVGVKDQVRYMLSGGLTPENVAAAIEATGARRVDVSSGVERRPGHKDPELIRSFVRAAKAVKTLA
jgi:phosphoribosylanthranilate isomerase